MPESIRLNNVWVIPLTLILAMMLAIIPLPVWLTPLRPDWVGMVVIFWSMMLPRTVSVGTAWVSGLLLDVLLGSPLGQNALTFVIIVYITSHMHRQLLSTTLLQQALFVSLLLMIRHFLIFWINGMSGHLPESLWPHFLPALFPLVLWPWLFIILRDFGRKHRIIPK
ncbi:rod shape-determining protein MreD [Granulosicoccaceae sp. 1_MG-2023]|nr:rod shape-determining protein MreD [Granulosicoccaceae sp. 1_MG-2023]